MIWYGATLFLHYDTLNIVNKVPKVKSSVGSPEAARAESTADGPGMGTTTTFFSTHNFTCGQTHINYSSWQVLMAGKKGWTKCTRINKC